MNCLLLVPHLKNTIAEPYTFPFSFGVVSAAMKQYDELAVHTLNLSHSDGDHYNEVRREIRAKNIETVLVDGSSWVYRSVKAALEAVKAVDPRIKTVVCGKMMSGDPETAMTALGSVDYGLIGEAELSAPSLMLALKRGEDPAAVDGLIIKTDRGPIRTRVRKEMHDLSALPWCDYDGFGFDFYLNHLPTPPQWIGASTPKRSATILSNRGCRSKCTFCAHEIWKAYRERPLEDYFAEVAHVVERYKIEHIHAAPQMFATNMPRLEEFCRRIKEFNLKGWSGVFRSADLNEEKIALLRDSGLFLLGLGVESPHNDILKNMRKNESAELIGSRLEMILRAGVRLCGAFILGDPAETYESALATLDWWEAHPEHDLQIGPVLCYPGTKIYKDAVKSGRINDPVQFLKDGFPPVNISRMTDNEYDDLINRRCLAAVTSRLESRPNFKDLIFLQADSRRRSISFEGTCHYCGKKTQYDKICMFEQSWLLCRHCPGVHKMPDLVDIKPSREIVEDNLRVLLASHARIGFWGIGSLFRALIEPGWVDHPNVHLLDQAAGQLFGTKKIQPPEEVINLGLDMVAIIPPEVSAHHEAISRAAVEDYGLASLITLYDFLSGDLSLPIARSSRPG